jgi:hypothetical protein
MPRSDRRRSLKPKGQSCAGTERPTVNRWGHEFLSFGPKLSVLHNRTRVLSDGPRYIPQHSSLLLAPHVHGAYHQQEVQ